MRLDLSRRTKNSFGMIISLEYSVHLLVKRWHWIIRSICVGCCFVVIFGCESDSTLDSVMNADPEFRQPPLRPSNAPGTMGSTGELVPLDLESNINTPPSTPMHGISVSHDGISNTDRTGQASGNPEGIRRDVPIDIDQPRISRENFVIKLSIPARELLLDLTKKPGNSYLLVGKVTPTRDDWQHISFVDFYEPDRQFQFRTNGVKILVPRELVNRLHNATIDLDPEGKQLFVNLAR